MTLEQARYNNFRRLRREVWWLFQIGGEVKIIAAMLNVSNGVIEEMLRARSHRQRM
jgi:hypothetical protein